MCMPVADVTFITFMKCYFNATLHLANKRKWKGNELKIAREPPLLCSTTAMQCEQKRGRGFVQMMSISEQSIASLALLTLV